MKYKDLISKSENLTALMQKLGLISEITEIRGIDCQPDYSLTDYRKFDQQDYVFTKTLKFPMSLFSIYKIEIIEHRIYPTDSLQDLIKEYKIKDLTVGDGEEILNFLHEKDQEVFEQNGFSADIDQFKLNDIRVSAISNEDSDFTLLGSFKGTSDAISPMDWRLYTQFKFTGYREDINKLDFYRQLFVESFLMYARGNFRIGFFLAYSAIDGFVNQKLSLNESQNSSSSASTDRLTDKINKLFRCEFPDIDLVNHQIYSSTIRIFKRDQTALRNLIAHGNNVHVDEDQAREMLFISLMLTLSITNRQSKFSELLLAK